MLGCSLVLHRLLTSEGFPGHQRDKARAGDPLETELVWRQATGVYKFLGRMALAAVLAGAVVVGPAGRRGDMGGGISCHPQNSAQGLAHFTVHGRQVATGRLPLAWFAPAAPCPEACCAARTRTHGESGGGGGGCLQQQSQLGLVGLDAVVGRKQVCGMQLRYHKSLGSLMSRAPHSCG